ncbi:MAG TPA: sirohydrochlorin cobaltochelatase [Clostridiales bacterium]|nr:sirohydrochlorin cobaltochelatase [Clostridiales bacterium]
MAENTSSEIKKAVLVVSFGTTHMDTLEKTIEPMEEDVRKAYPEYEVRRAFTSGIIRKILNKRDGIATESPEEALAHLKEDGYREVEILPFIIMPGKEYDGILRTFYRFLDDKTFDSLKIGRPLLYSHEDFENLIGILKENCPAKSEEEACVLMGHGSYHPGNACFSQLQSMTEKEGITNIHIGTVEGYPELSDVINKLKGKGYKKLHLMPLMLVAGDHAKNDMAGDDEDSWNSALKSEGYETEVHLVGLGENEKIRSLFVERMKEGVKPRHHHH